MCCAPKKAVTNHEPRASDDKEPHLYHAPGHHLRENVDGFGSEEHRIPLQLKKLPQGTASKKAMR